MSQAHVAAVILAAGASSRFGSPKQLAFWQNSTFLETVVDTALAAPANPVIVVLGANADACRRKLGNRRQVTLVINENWAEGQSTSMKAGLKAVPDSAEAALFLLVDQPLIQPETIAKLVERYQQTQTPLVWPEFEGKRGNPVLFSRSLFAQMMRVKGDTGARPVLMKYKSQAERVSVLDEGVLLDFDKPEDMLS